MKSTWNSRQGWTLNEVSDEEFLAFTMLLNSYRKREGVSLMKHVATMIARETVEEAMNAMEPFSVILDKVLKGQ